MFFSSGRDKIARGRRRAAASAACGKRLHFHEPLVRIVRLDHGVAAVAVAHRMGVVFYFFNKAERLHVRDHLLAAGKTVHADVFLRDGAGHAAGLVHDHDGRHGVAQAHLKVVRVVRGRHLDRAGAEFPVHEIVGDDGDFTIDKRQHKRSFPQAPCSARRPDSPPRRCRRAWFRAAWWRRVTNPCPSLKGYLKWYSLPLDFLVLGLLVRQRGPAARAPVDDVFAPVDEPFVVKLHEHFAHRAGEPFVHGKALAVPVAGGAELLKLVGDGRMVLFFPLPHFLDKRLAAQVVAGLFLLCEFLLNDVLRGDAGMVGARHPQGLEARHALETG